MIEKTDTTDMVDLMGLQLEPHGVDHKVVELRVIFVKIPSSAKKEYGWRKYHHINKQKFCWKVG